MTRAPARKGSFVPRNLVKSATPAALAFLALSCGVPPTFITKVNVAVGVCDCALSLKQQNREPGRQDLWLLGIVQSSD